MKVTLHTNEELRLEEHPPWIMYFAATGVTLVGVGAAFFFGGETLFFVLELIAALYAGWSVLEESEVIRFTIKDDRVSITRIPPLPFARRHVVSGRLSEIVSIRLDEQLSQMWGKMSRISVLFEDGLRLPLTTAYSRLPQEDLLHTIDNFLEIAAPQLVDQEDDEEETPISQASISSPF
jgi:hypothetical protein